MQREANASNSGVVEVIDDESRNDLLESAIEATILREAVVHSSRAHVPVNGKRFKRCGKVKLAPLPALYQGTCQWCFGQKCDNCSYCQRMRARGYGKK